jgi:hypothetical protein
MNIQTILQSNDSDLSAYRAEIMKQLTLIDGELEKRRLAANRQVTVQEVDQGHYMLSHPTFGEFEAKRVAHGRRFRVWQRVQGTRGMKRGPVVIHEALGGLSSIRTFIANGAK